MSTLIPFAFDDSPLRVVLIEDQPWFIAADVCAVLELTNVTKALERLDDDEKTLTTIQGIHSGSGNPTVNLVSESGLYALIFTSRKAEARKFRKFVTAEVLPQIRRTGRYAPADDKPLVTALKARIAALTTDNTQLKDELLNLMRDKLATLTPDQSRKHGRATPEEIAMVLEMSALGLSFREIARRLGRSDTFVSYIVRGEQRKEQGELPL